MMLLHERRTLSLLPNTIDVFDYATLFVVASSTIEYTHP